MHEFFPPCTSNPGYGSIGSNTQWPRPKCNGGRSQSVSPTTCGHHRHNTKEEDQQVRTWIIRRHHLRVDDEFVELASIPNWGILPGCRFAKQRIEEAIGFAGREPPGFVRNRPRRKTLRRVSGSGCPHQATTMVSDLYARDTQTFAITGFPAVGFSFLYIDMIVGSCRRSLGYVIHPRIFSHCRKLP